MWRVLVVEDDPQMREFFADSVSRCAGLLLATSVGTVAEAIFWLDAHASTTDVLLTDLGLPDGSRLIGAEEGSERAVRRIDQPV